MSAVNKPRHEVVFTMSSDSKGKVDDLLQQCGHKSLNLLLARGLALVQWVEDQTDMGRTIGSVIYGADGVEEVFELTERQEFLPPRQLVPAASAPVAHQAPEPAPKVEPVAAFAPNPKLVARSRNPAPPKPSRIRSPNRGAEIMRAHVPNDTTGPVKTHTWVSWKCQMEGRVPPILIGDNRALPGELTDEHLPELARMLKDARHATHFQLTKDNFLAYYGFVPGAGKGWCYLEEGSMRLLPDSHCDGGLFAIFPVVMAVEYLERLLNPPREVASA